MHPVPQQRQTRSADALILFVSGCLALLPYLVYHDFFARLFWFGDEFDLIDQIDHLGLWKWMWLMFAENFVPLFKGLWGGEVLLFGGSYAAMIATLWITHAVNVALLGKVMRTCGLSWTAVFLAQVAFGLTPGNIETLAWSVQWSAVLAMTFMLLALDVFFTSQAKGASLAWITASALSFSRGVLTGLLVAAGALFPREGESASRFPRRVFAAGVFLAPSVIVAILIATIASGNHQHMAGHAGDAAAFGTWYWGLNPLHFLLSVESVGWRTVTALGALKLALIVWAIARSRGRIRLLFLLLVAFDLGNAVLLGIGRFNTGFPATMSSRYQYASLVGIVPLAGYLLSRVVERLPFSRIASGVLVAGLLGALGLSMIRGWSADADSFTRWRGTDSRRVILQDLSTDTQAVPGIPGMTMDRARELVAKYRLH
ncbi:MAG: hypothetical protein ABSF76_06935 [Opitutaceae bacterium]|jgi:hypothetical protein